jgi:MFS family permease
VTASLDAERRRRVVPLPVAIVATSCSFAAVVRGAGDTFTVFLLPIERSLGIGHGETTGIYALTMIAIGVAGPFAGTLTDRMGPRVAFGLGTLVLAGAFLAASGATLLWQLQLALGIGVGIAVACVGMSAQGPLIGRWFTGREATIFGVISGAAGIGALVFAPLSQLLIDAWGWREAYRILASIVALLILPLALLPWRRIAAGPPAADDAAPAPREARPSATGAPAVAWTRILADPLLARLVLSHLLTCVAVFCIQVLVVAYLVDSGYTPLVAASAVGAAGLATALGVAGFAWLSDRVGWFATLTASFMATATGIAALWAMAWRPEPWLLVPYVLGLGLSLGSRGPLLAGLAMRRFAGRAVGRVLGTLLFAFGLGSATGAWLGGFLHEATGGYHAAFMVAGGALVLSYLLWWTWPDRSQADARS